MVYKHGIGLNFTSRKFRRFYEIRGDDAKCLAVIIDTPTSNFSASRRNDNWHHHLFFAHIKCSSFSLSLVDTLAISKKCNTNCYNYYYSCLKGKILGQRFIGVLENNDVLEYKTFQKFLRSLLFVLPDFTVLSIFIIGL